MTGIPITNVNNNYCAGSTAFLHAANADKTSLAGCPLAFGFERMASGTIITHFPNRTSPTALWAVRTAELEETLGGNHRPVTPRMFSNAGKEFCAKYGAKVELYSRSVSSRSHV